MGAIEDDVRECPTCCGTETDGEVMGLSEYTDTRDGMRRVVSTFLEPYRDEIVTAPHGYEVMLGAWPRGYEVTGCNYRHYHRTPSTACFPDFDEVVDSLTHELVEDYYVTPILGSYPPIPPGLVELDMRHIKRVVR